jgi:hypothetical protein
MKTSSILKKLPSGFGIASVLLALYGVALVSKVVGFDIV